MKKITYMIFLLLLFTFWGCTSKPTMTTLKPLTKKVADITFSLKYLSEKELLSLHRREGNVFADYPGRIPPKKTIVFALDISTEETIVNFNINDIHLSIGEQTGASKTQYQILRAWQSYLKEPTAERKAKKMVKQRMFIDEITVTPETPASGWIVFLENYPDSGSAVLSIEMSTDNGDAGTIEIPMDFSIDETQLSFIENTGIFSKKEK